MEPGERQSLSFLSAASSEGNLEDKAAIAEAADAENIKSRRVVSLMSAP
jgi:hypothetical protein